jgi:L-asparaginase
LYFYTVLFLMQDPSTLNIVILATGGTIAGQAADASDLLGYTAAQLGVAQLVASLPPSQTAGLLTEQVAQLDSKDMDFAAWAQLAQRVNYFLARPDVQGIVITHGTDTLEETAYFLHRVCQASKPVVLTGAMRPATSLAADGPQNLADAVTLARTPGVQGVLVVLAGVVHSAVAVQKVHPHCLAAFSSGDEGPVGQVQAGVFSADKNKAPAQYLHAPYAIELIANKASAEAWPWVEIVLSHAGCSGAAVDALVAHGVAGLVVAATGNGTVHRALEDALRRALSAGVAVLRTSRCAYGRVLHTPTAWLPDAGGLSPVKARIALILQLMAQKNSSGGSAG